MPNRKASSKKVVLLSNNPCYNLSSYASLKKMTAVEAVTNENNLNGVLHLEQIQGEHFNTPVLDNTEENLTPIATVLQPCLVHDPQLLYFMHYLAWFNWHQSMASTLYMRTDYVSEEHGCGKWFAHQRPPMMLSKKHQGPQR